MSRRLLFYLTTRSLIAATIITPSEQPKKIKQKASQYDRINGHYQNRIRQLSTPEKIFTTFATKINKKTGQAMMNFNDFCEAILPYDFRNEKTTNVTNNNNNNNNNNNIPIFLMELIMGNKNINNTSIFKINLSEFIFITCLLSIPPSDFEFVFKIFDLDGNGKMDSNEFKFLLEHFKKNNTSNYDIINNENIIKKTNIWKYLFGKNENKQLTLIEFQSFLYKLRECILKLEYERYCGSINNNISSKNFAMSLISYAHHSDVSYYVARVNRIKFEKCIITYNDFLNFNKCLFYINDIMRALKYYEKGKENITQKAFHHTVKCITNINLNKNLINIMFYVLDRNGDNTLNQKEIKTLLSERFQYGQANDRIFLAKIFKCFKDCYYE